MKLGDFGISKRLLNQSTALRTEVGTRAFSAPETTPDDYEETFQYTNAVDMWSLGCVIYSVLAHSLPYKNSHAKSFPFPTQPLKDRVNDQGINLLECLLRVDPSARWTAQKAVKHAWLHASGEASSAAVEDATENASSVAQPQRRNEIQDKRHHPNDQVDMPTFISSMEKTCPKLADRTETPINQSTLQPSGHRGMNCQSNLSSKNGGRRRTTSNMLISPSRYRISDSVEDPGSETLMPRRARSRLPKDAERGLHEGDMIKKPTLSPQMPTVVSRPSNIWLGTSSSSSDDECQGATRGLHEADTIKKPTSSPVMPAIVSRPSNTGLGTSYSSSNDVGEGATTNIDMNMSDDGKTVSSSRLPQFEEQGPEKMELVTTLRHIHTQFGHPEHNKIARVLELIRKGVNLEMRSDGETALHLAVGICHFNKGDHATQILHELLERGADVDATNKIDQTALHMAVLCTHRNHNGDELEVVRQLIKYRANVNAGSDFLCTPLHYAALVLCAECIDMLLAAGAWINELANDGGTALHWALCDEAQGQIVARKLILAGIDINVVNKVGLTALDVARERKRSGVIEVIEEAQEQRRRSHWNGKDAHSGRRKHWWHIK